MFLPKLQPLPYKTSKVLFPVGFGVNNGYSELDIKSGYSSDESNLDSREYPSLHVRTTRKNFSDDLAGTIYGLGKRNDDNLIAVDGTVGKYWTGSAWSNIWTGLTAANAEISNFNDYTILVNGTDNKYWDGASDTGDLADMPASNYIAVHANRMYSASNSTNVLSFSALNDHTDWTTANDAGSITIDEGQVGGNASGLVAYANHIIYFKNSSMHELYGTGPLNYRFQTISDRIGCVSHRTIVEVHGILFWLGYEGVYWYTGGTAPSLISSPYIQSYIDNLDTSNLTKACAGTDGDRYYLCLPQTGGTFIVLTCDIEKAMQENFKQVIWHVEDTTEFKQFETLQRTLYGMPTNGQMLKMVDSTGTETIAWSYETGKKILDYPSTKTNLRHVYIVGTIPTGTTAKLAIKTNEGSYTDIQTLSTSSSKQRIRVIVPKEKVHNANWFQLKLYGSGSATINRIEMQVRLRRDSYYYG